MEVYNPCNVKVTWNGITLEDGFDQVVTVARTKHLPVGVNDIECEITFTDESMESLNEHLQVKEVFGFVAEPHKTSWLSSPPPWRLVGLFGVMT